MSRTGTRPGTRRGPIDPRLASQVRAARSHLVLSTVLGLVQSACVIVTALALARLGSDLLEDRVPPAASPRLLVLLAAALAVRAGAVLVQQRTGHRAATRAIAELRARVVGHAARRGPRAGAGRGADVTALATTGLERLRPYLVGYVPQLLLAATLTPLCLVVIGVLDLTSAIIAAVTLPLVPVFMILVGRLTEGRSERLLADMRSLWTQLLDLVEGLPTLVALGRERGPERSVRELGRRHHASAMGSLRYAFLSAMVLELLATLCVALIAVSIGLRLVYGQMDLAPALAILVLAPEVYLPLRAVGQQYHASTDGLAAADAAFAVLDEPLPAPGDVPAPDLRSSILRADAVSVASRTGTAPHAAAIALEPGRITALTGPSGAGKTTLAHVLLGLLHPDAGGVEIVPSGGTPIPLEQIDRASLWRQVAYLPQRPVLPPGSIREVLAAALPAPAAATAGSSGAAQRAIADAARATGLDAVIVQRGEDAPVGRAGAGLSLGERQRLALARALLSPAQLVVLDEPTAHLDGASEQVVLDALDAFRAAGRTVLVIAHRETLLARADAVVAVHARASADSTEEAAA
ncbi:thiol reductant ABC exporter subunit CydD [Brachybacterium phenoliresistens]|uniref:thiol reductant ABC exporter subunit CydD n=1 Tax=Brachybacterium phenoliresistens TaxID=396014 RepID=UPI0031D12E3F